MKFINNDDNLTIKFAGVEKLLAFKSKLVLAKSEIEDLHWEAEFSDKDRVLRIGGTGVPFVLLAGRFKDLSTGDRLFLYVRKPNRFASIGGFGAKNLLVVTMKSGKYVQIMVNCQPGIGAQLTKWFRS